MSYAANKVTEGTQTAIFGIRHLFEEFWNKLAYVFNKIKWGLFVQFILIVLTFIWGSYTDWVLRGLLLNVWGKLYGY